MKLPPYVENVIAYLGDKEEKYLGTPSEDAAARLRKEIIDESLTAKNPAPRDETKEVVASVSLKNPKLPTQEVVQHYYNGHSVMAIANHYGVQEDEVKTVLLRARVRPRIKGRVGRGQPIDKSDSPDTTKRNPHESEEDRIKRQIKLVEAYLSQPLSQENKEYFEKQLEKLKAKLAEKKNPRLSAGHEPSEFDQEELRRGTKHEMEHTDDKSEAQRIAMDHLVEDPHYYTRLDKCLVKNPSNTHRLFRDLHKAEVLRIIDMLPDKLVDKRERMIKKFRELKKPEYAAMLEQLSNDDWHDFVVNHAECVHWGVRHNPESPQDKVKEAAKKMLALNDRLPEEYRFTKEEKEDLERDAGLRTDELETASNPTRPAVAELTKVFKKDTEIPWIDPKTKQKKKILVAGFDSSNLGKGIAKGKSAEEKKKQLDEVWRDIELFTQKMVDEMLTNVLDLDLKQSRDARGRVIPGALEFRPSSLEKKPFLSLQESAEADRERVERNRYYKLLLTSYLMSLLRKFFFLDKSAIEQIEGLLEDGKPSTQKSLYGNREAFAMSIYSGMAALTSRVNPPNLILWLKMNQDAVSELYVDADKRWKKIQAELGKQGKKAAETRRAAIAKNEAEIESLDPGKEQDDSRSQLAALEPVGEKVRERREKKPEEEKSSSLSVAGAVRQLSSSWSERKRGIEKNKTAPIKGAVQRQSRKRGEERG